jgi:hypothetical protein
MGGHARTQWATDWLEQNALKDQEVYAIDTLRLDWRNAKPRPAKPISIIAQVELFGLDAASQHVEKGRDCQHDHKAPVLAISKERGDCFDYLLDHCGLRLATRLGAPRAHAISWQKTSWMTSIRNGSSTGP